MARIYYWLLMSIASSVVGSAFSSWFEKTHLGIWFYAKVDALMNWAADRYKLEQLKTENRFKRNFPTMYERIVEIEKRLDIDNKK